MTHVSKAHLEKGRTMDAATAKNIITRTRTEIDEMLHLRHSISNKDNDDEGL